MGQGKEYCTTVSAGAGDARGAEFGLGEGTATLRHRLA